MLRASIAESSFILKAALPAQPDPNQMSIHHTPKTGICKEKTSRKKADKVTVNH